MSKQTKNRDREQLILTLEKTLLRSGFEGIVTQSKVKPEFGRRYFFLPRYFMLQSRHSGLVNIIAGTEKVI